MSNGMECAAAAAAYWYTTMYGNRKVTVKVPDFNGGTSFEF